MSNLNFYIKILSFSLLCELSAIRANAPVFIGIFLTLEDPRADTEHKLHHFIDIVCIAICAVICRCETWDEISDFGELKKDWLKKFSKTSQRHSFSRYLQKRAMKLKLFRSY